MAFFSRFLNDAPIKARILVLTLVPTVALALMAGYMQFELLGTVNQAGKLKSLVGLAPNLSAVVHEMQKERGQSAGFISSKGVNFADRLPAQRKHTDEAIAKMSSALDGFDAEEFNHQLSLDITEGREALTKLADMRKRVGSLDASVKQMAGYYTGTIRKLLTVISEMAALSTNAEVTRTISAYLAVLEGKERAGVERAMGAAGFGAGEFKPAVYQRFVGLIAMQDSFFSTYGVYASHDQKAFMKQTVAGPVVDKVEGMRKAALASPQTGHTGGITAGDWFNAITAKINLYKKVEDKVRDDLIARLDAIQSGAKSMFWAQSVTLVVLFAAIIVLSLKTIASLVPPLRALTGDMERLSEGDTDIQIDHVERGDEVGAMSRAMEVFRENAIERARMREQEATETERKAREQQRMTELTSTFAESTAGIVNSLSEAAKEMQGTAQTLGGAVSEATERVSGAVAGSDNASQNVSMVASSAEELASSIDEINRQVAQANAAVGQVEANAKDSSERVNKLAGSVRKIDEVVTLIQDIAEQTNLLALNATIEAARAGDAGKGFAVVATEVKELANQTAKATEEITAQISEVQQSTDLTVSTITEITGAVENVQSMTSAIAAAVEEQGAATSEISRSVQAAAGDTQQVSENINGVAAASDRTKVSTETVQSVSENLATQAANLKQEVDNFLKNIAA